jgi:plastocyanin
MSSKFLDSRSQLGKEKMGRILSIAILTVTLVIALMATKQDHHISIVSAQQKPESKEIKIDNFSFGPGTLTVAVGSTVTWTNRDEMPHTAVSTDGIFKSKVMDTDEKFTYTFERSGTFTYFCSIHPKMTGKVVVQ